MVAFSYDEYLSKISEETKLFVDRFISYLYTFESDNSEKAALKPSNQLLCCIGAYESISEKNANIIKSLDIIEKRIRWTLYGKNKSDINRTFTKHYSYLHHFHAKKIIFY